MGITVNAQPGSIINNYDIHDNNVVNVGVDGIMSKDNGNDEKEKALRESNEVLAVRLHGHRVLFVPLYEFVADNFVNGLKGKNRWCALRAFLKDKGLLAVEDNKAFAEQMNSDAWFGWVEEEQRCSIEALKVYAAVDFGREKMSEMQFDASAHGSNAKYAGYCELKLVYDKLCNVWDEGKILEKL